MLNLLRIFWIYVPPIIILTGTVGNGLTLITIANEQTKKNSFVVHLGALAVADTAASYSTTLNAWLFYGLGIDIMLSEPSCKIFGFLHHVCKMWSSLLVAALSVDRMVGVCWPQTRDRFSTPKSALIVVSCCLGFVLIINAHELYGFTIITVDNVTFCGYIDDKYATFFDIYFIWVDNSIYFILPTVVIIVSNTVTVRKVIITTKQAGHLMRSAPAIRKRIRDQRQVIITAITVSITFILLTSPYSILTIIRPYVFDSSDMFYVQSDVEFLVTSITAMLATLNYAINFFLYFVSGKRFREDLKAAFRCGRSSRVAPSEDGL